VMNWKSQSG